MELTLTINAESEDELRVYLQANSMAYSIQELDQYLRNEIKYNESISKCEYKTFEKIREKIREVLNKNEVILDL